MQEKRGQIPDETQPQESWQGQGLGAWGERHVGKVICVKAHGPDGVMGPQVSMRDSTGKGGGEGIKADGFPDWCRWGQSDGMALRQEAQTDVALWGGRQ